MDYSTKEDIIESFFEKIKDCIVPSESNNYKSRFLQSNILLYFVVLLLVLKIFAVLLSTNFPQNIFFADITKSTLENFINQARQANGLGTLTENTKLDQAAQMKAENMVQNQYFDHTSPTGITPWFWFLQAGYKYKYAGENLAVGFYDSQEVYDAWLNSPSHKANILNPHYTDVGTAVLAGFGPNNSIVVVQEFASPLPAKVAVNNTPKTTNTQPVGTTPVVKINGSAPATNTNTNEKVLSQETESQNSLEAPNGNSASNLPSKLLNSVMYNYNELLQNVAFGISLIVIAILLTMIFLNTNLKFSKQLVFRSVLIMILLTATTLLNRDLMISLIPHQILI